MKNKTFKCCKCNQTKPIQYNSKNGGCGGTGYTSTKNGDTICFDCCAVVDREYMESNGRTVLYLSNGEVTNWPGTLRFKVGYQKTGRHNIAGKRYDVWFSDSHGRAWHGVQYGDNTQLCHCRRLAA